MGPSTITRRLIAALAPALIAALAAASPASAAQPAAIHIVSPMTFNEATFNTGTFEASGPAVDAGLMCASGRVEDYAILLAGGQSGRGLQIPVRKEFACADGSGSIFIKIQVHLDFATSTETFSWVVLAGSGSYAGLRGSGSGTTVSDGSDPQTGNINTYGGFVVG